MSVVKHLFGGVVPAHTRGYCFSFIIYLVASTLRLTVGRAFLLTGLSTWGILNVKRGVTI